MPPETGDGDRIEHKITAGQTRVSISRPAATDPKHPVVLGVGERLFGSGTVPAALTLVDTRKTSTGVVVNSYRRAGKPTYGSFSLDQ